MGWGGISGWTNYDLKNEMSCGLGLAIVKKIVDMHGGDVVFESKDGINSVQIAFGSQNVDY